MSAALALVLSLVAGQEVPGSAPLRPAEVVAQQVRTVLYAEDDQAALRGLAGALPELALKGDADLQATFAAARLAEELSGGPIRPDQRMQAGEPEIESPSFALTLLRGINPEFLGTLMAMIAISVAFWWAGGNSRLPSLSTFLDDVKAIVLPRVRAVLKRPDGHQVRIQRALTLASSGLPLGEVARQTGISRDALGVLLRMSR